ncbi:MAG TPA: MOSC N-terminal beta barrel domain-containing protein [Egibacteraceae bacterium]|nr:MOSC N-terminal beta barrel domain-containing protein [Egibacteraceae bacterium]
MAVISALRVVPVKGLHAVARDALHLDRDGIAEDRRLFLLDAAGEVVTMREHAGLVQAVPDLDLAAGVLRVTVPDGRSVSTALAAVTEPVSAELYGKQRTGRVLPGDVSDALSDLAGAPLRVVLGDRTGVGWDEGPISILGSASAAEIGAPRGDTVRYRMTVEVDGLAPFEEDTWVGEHVGLGDAVVAVTHPLQRCVVITMSPDTGAQDWDGLHALARRRGRDHLCLGVIAEVAEPGVVRVGDEVIGPSAGRAAETARVR